MIRPPDKLDRGFKFMQRWCNRLRDFVIRTRVIAVNGFEETPQGILPPPQTKVPFPPLYPILYLDRTSTPTHKITVTGGYVIAKNAALGILGRHVPKIEGSKIVSGADNRSYGLTVESDHRWLMLEIDYGNGKGTPWLQLCEARFIVSATVLSSDECTQRIPYAPILHDGPNSEPRIDYTRALSGHFYANIPDLGGSCSSCPSESSSSSSSGSFSSASGSSAGSSSGSTGPTRPDQLCLSVDGIQTEDLTLTNQFAVYEGPNYSLDYDDVDGKWILYFNGLVRGELVAAATAPAGDYGNGYVIAEGPCGSSSSSASGSSSGTTDAVCVTFPDATTATFTRDGEEYVGPGGFSLTYSDVRDRWELWEFANALAYNADLAGTYTKGVDGEAGGDYIVELGPCPTSSSSSSAAPSAGSSAAASSSAASSAAASSSAAVSSAAPSSSSAAASSAASSAAASSSSSAAIKASWILPVVNLDGEHENVALSPLEHPEELFADTYTIPVDANGCGMATIESFLLQVCERNSLRVTSIVPVGGHSEGTPHVTVTENLVYVHPFPPRPLLARLILGKRQHPAAYRVTLTGRKIDGAGRWVRFTDAQRDRNKAFYASAYAPETAP